MVWKLLCRGQVKQSIEACVYEQKPEYWTGGTECSIVDRRGKTCPSNCLLFVDEGTTSDDRCVVERTACVPSILLRVPACDFHNQRCSHEAQGSLLHCDQETVAVAMPLFS